MGFLHGHLADESLEADVRRFLKKHAPDCVDGLTVQIVKGHFKKAHAMLQTPIPREIVHKLNRLPFVEDGMTRTICVDDGHGSPGQNCPKFIAGYCRGQNLRFTHPCWCRHPQRPTENARFELTPISLDSAKGVELQDKFMASGPFHNGYPRVIGIKAIQNDRLSRCHEEYRDYLTTKHLEEPAVQELYHGTNNNILDILYKHGLQPPSDTQASDRCPKSGGKGLCTTLCNNDCTYCTEKHEWNKCHMYGLGIYLADMAQKSHRYVSQPKTSNSGRQTYRMVVCSVLGKSFQVEGHLRAPDAMHDIVNVRSLTEEMVEDMVEQCQACCAQRGVGASIRGYGGDVWGRVVADEGHCWRLHTGRIAKKETDGSGVGRSSKKCPSCKGSGRKDLGSCNECQGARTSPCNHCVSSPTIGKPRPLCAICVAAAREKSDLLFVKGLGSAVRPGSSVVNSEYIAFHPHQCLPKYEIEYEVR